MAFYKSNKSSAGKSKAGNGYAPYRKTESGFGKGNKERSDRYEKSDKFDRNFDKKSLKSFDKSNRFGEKAAFAKSRISKVQGEGFGTKKGFSKSVKPSFGRDFAPAPKHSQFEYESKKPVKTLEPKVERSLEELASQDENLLVGRNPIREALKSGRDIEKLLVLKGELSGSASEIIAKAKALKIPVQEVEKKRLDQLASHHQGLIAFASAYQYHDIDEILTTAEERGEAPFIVMLDGLTDPHNLGAIIRSAECAGAHGIIIPQRRSAGLTATAVKASAGAVEHIKVCRVTNLKGMMDSLKRRGLWVYAADMEGEAYESVDFSGPCLLVIGSEGEGISQLLLENADKRVSIPLKGEIDSLNASVAAGILLFQIAKGR